MSVGGKKVPKEILYNTTYALKIDSQRGTGWFQYSSDGLQITTGTPSLHDIIKIIPASADKPDGFIGPVKYGDNVIVYTEIGYWNIKEDSTAPTINGGGTPNDGVVWTIQNPTTPTSTATIRQSDPIQFANSTSPSDKIEIYSKLIPGLSPRHIQSILFSGVGSVPATFSFYNTSGQISYSENACTTDADCSSTATCVSGICTAKPPPPPSGPPDPTPTPSDSLDLSKYIVYIGALFAFIIINATTKNIFLTMLIVGIFTFAYLILMNTYLLKSIFPLSFNDISSGIAKQDPKMIALVLSTAAICVGGVGMVLD